MKKKILAALAALAVIVPGGISLATTATAAENQGSPADSETWRSQSILTTDGTDYAGEIAFDNTRTGYANEGTTGTVPAGERYDFLKYTQISDIFYVAEQHTRTTRVSNTTDEAFTVSGITASLISKDYAGETVTHLADPLGTNVLTAPQADIIVPAGETVFLQFDTLDPVVSVVRTNENGEVAGIGSITRFDFTINGENYWFKDSAGFGSAQVLDFTDPNPELSTENLFPACESESTGGGSNGTNPEIWIGMCAWYSTQSMQFDASYFTPSAPTPEEPVTVPEEPTIAPATVSGTVKDTEGNPLIGFKVTLRNSDGVVTHTATSDESGFWGVTDVYPSRYSAYVLVGDVWTLILSPEDFDVVGEEPLTDKDFVLDRSSAVIVPPVVEPTPEPTPVTEPPAVVEPPAVETPVLAETGANAAFPASLALLLLLAGGGVLLLNKRAGRRVLTVAAATAPLFVFKS